MCLESPTRLNKVKITNVNEIGKTYLKLRGYHNTEIYGNWAVADKVPEIRLPRLGRYHTLWLNNNSM